MNNNTKVNIDDLSIVITTIGEKILFNTVAKILDQVHESSNFEILVCIYNKNNFKIQNLKNKKFIKIINTKIPGQVGQRIEGFKNAKKNYILQLDDDCKICLEDICKLKNKLEELPLKSAICALNRRNIRIITNDLPNQSSAGRVWAV